MSIANPPSTGPHTTSSAPTHHARTNVSRAGHVVGVLVNLVVLYLINVRPGWEAVSFLTEQTTLVLGLVNLSLWVSAAAEASYVVTPSRGWRALGDVATTGVGLAALVRVWQVFPFDLGSFWETMVRVVLVVGVGGSLIGIVAALSRLIRWGSRSEPVT
jgi:hypothetical protein